MGTARLAIPLFGEEIAPRFCFADEFLLADREPGSPVTRYTVGDVSWPQRITQLAERQVTLVLCGGFNRSLLPLAVSHGIEVVWGLYGSAQDVLRAYYHGDLDAFRLQPSQPSAPGAAAMGSSTPISDRPDGAGARQGGRSDVWPRHRSRPGRDVTGDLPAERATGSNKRRKLAKGRRRRAS